MTLQISSIWSCITHFLYRNKLFYVNDYCLAIYIFRPKIFVSHHFFITNCNNLTQWLQWQRSKIVDRFTTMRYERRECWKPLLGELPLWPCLYISVVVLMGRSNGIQSQPVVHKFLFSCIYITNRQNQICLSKLPINFSIFTIYIYVRYYQLTSELFKSRTIGMSKITIPTVAGCSIH